jgi:hypothetical protein
LAEISLQGDAPWVQIQIVRASPQSLSWAAGPEAGGSRFGRSLRRIPHEEHRESAMLVRLS